ncbi:hypothetical protein PROFUN_14400 [Planoprotostelium fungivorum]|uniref:Uncharacterized protein n=1 Tax=Planoprotostelium fungivorum TaxID=1890364 RepID=A0A2P6N0D1_9EUKA|nr:hypothetical protein PROFUN_14400 [Planoprotostelium fungivorum]
MEETNRSLLDVFHEAIQKQNKTEYIDRVVYVGSICDANVSNRKDIGTSLERFFNRYHNDSGIPESAITQNSITGILLILQHTCIHLLEGPPKMIRAHLRDLAQTPPSKKFIDGTKILMFSEDISRNFPCWRSRVLNISKTTSVPEQEETETAITETYLNLLQLGAILPYPDTNKLEETLDSLRTKHRELIPSNERIQNFLDADDVFGLEEWLEFYDRPMELALERDLVWPSVLLSSLPRNPLSLNENECTEAYIVSCSQNYAEGPAVPAPVQNSSGRGTVPVCLCCIVDRDKANTMGGDWDVGACDCCGDMKVCCVTCYCLPCQLAYNNAAVQGTECSFVDFLLACYCTPCCGTAVRGKIRDKYGIDGSVVGDFCCHFCFGCCATIQQTRQLDKRGAKPAGMFMDS